ncbi:uncharacterized protein KGF55_002759 [Candida pseudojiufengensis]|uniref:uncharacterized protein n=1 Tax=Candida pseudojiufengensis TaxID=497109 RepID=UPI0022247208|nr:uncharacterized protein KGF55_002759 [Candida pseudojiufengensis]KAI5962967.1 hypothetical protein KGF55_002759 [Candida pseudojiufengensis]
MKYDLYKLRERDPGFSESTQVMTDHGPADYQQLKKMLKEGVDFKVLAINKETGRFIYRSGLLVVMNYSKIMMNHVENNGAHSIDFMVNKYTQVMSRNESNIHIERGSHLTFDVTDERYYMPAVRPRYLKVNEPQRIQTRVNGIDTQIEKDSIFKDMVEHYENNHELAYVIGALAKRSTVKEDTIFIYSVNDDISKALTTLDIAFKKGSRNKIIVNDLDFFNYYNQIFSGFNGYDYFSKIPQLAFTMNKVEVLHFLRGLSTVGIDHTDNMIVYTLKEEVKDQVLRLSLHAGLNACEIRNSVSITQELNMSNYSLSIESSGFKEVTYKGLVFQIHFNKNTGHPENDKIYDHLLLIGPKKLIAGTDIRSYKNMIVTSLK